MQWLQLRRDCDSSAPRLARDFCATMRHDLTCNGYRAAVEDHLRTVDAKILQAQLTQLSKQIRRPACIRRNYSQAIILKLHIHSDRQLEPNVCFDLISTAAGKAKIGAAHSACG